jgi:hypothetical protein
MELPLLVPAPVVAEHAVVFRDLFENQCQFRHFQHALTGLLVGPKKRRAHIARGILDRADQTPRSRFFSEAPGREDEVHRRRLRCLLHQTPPHRRRHRESRRVLDATLGEHVGRLVAHVDCHETQGDGPSPLAHHPVTRLEVRGSVRFPVGWRLERRDEAVPPWAAATAKHGPELTRPSARTARHRRQTPVDPVWLQEPELRARQAPGRPTIALAIALVEAASRPKGPLGVVVCDAWSLAADGVRVLARRRQDWSSRLNTNRLRDTASVHRREAHGWTRQRPGPHLGVATLVPLRPAPASRPVTVGAHPSWCVTLGGRIPGLGKVRLVVRFAPETWTGRQGVRVTHRVDWRAATSISLYAHRWPTETLDPDGQGPLGFHASRRRSAEAMGKHGGLVFGADALLPLTCLPAGPDRTQGLIHTMGDAGRPQGRAWLQRRVRFVHDQ